MSARLRIGTSGYQYDHWRGVFYPQDLAKSHWFDHYARHFDTVEINNTFYRLPSARTFDHWFADAPKDFCYALKFSRYGSHIKRLKDGAQTIQTFLPLADRLKDKLGPILVQLPPHWSVNVERLHEFLTAAPDGYRWVLEFRDRSWLCEEIFTLLSDHGAALCIHDMLEDHPRRITADFVYLRFHGDHYRGSYTHQFLAAEAARLREYLSQGMDVYAYFNNDELGYAVANALDLKRYLETD